MKPGLCYDFLLALPAAARLHFLGTCSCFRALPNWKEILVVFQSKFTLWEHVFGRGPRMTLSWRLGSEKRVRLARQSFTFSTGDSSTRQASGHTWSEAWLI